MRLSYQVRPHQVTFGGWDATPYLDAIGVTVPEIEIGEALTWTGDFQVSYNRLAQFAGLDDDDFSPFAYPERWRPDRPVVIEIENSQGQTGRISCRIQKYSYDYQTRTGRGTLYQLMDAVNRSRPSEVVETIIGAGGIELTSVVTQLVQASSGAIGLPSTSGIWGLIDDKVATRNPIEDAQKLAATCWRWLAQNRNEGVYTICGDPLTHPVLFRRSLAEVELDPDLENNNNWHSKSIVTGSYQQAKPAQEDCGNDQDIDNLDDKDRPKIIRTTSTATFAEVFPSANLGSGLTTAEEKTILYQYGNSPISENIQSLWAQVVGDLNIPNPLQVADYLPTIGQSDDSGVVATVTIRQKPSGSIFPQLGSATTLRVFDIQIESERRKTNLKPWGLLKPSEGANFTLYPAPDEQISPTSASRPDVSPGRQLNENGQQVRVCLEKPVQPEPRQRAPQFEMETVPVRGECTIAPVGWSPIVQLPLITDFGFLPSQGHADYLACQIAARETRRLYAYAVEMPVPDEWIAADAPTYFRCHIGAAEYEATAVELILAGEDGGSMRLRFRAHRIGAAPNIPSPPAPLPFVPAANGALQLMAPIGGAIGIAGTNGGAIGGSGGGNGGGGSSSNPGGGGNNPGSGGNPGGGGSNPGGGTGGGGSGAIATVQLQAFGGASNPTYSYSAVSPTPAWVTVNSSTGLVTIDYSAAPVEGFEGTARFRVSDGTSEVFQEISLEALPEYTVALDFREAGSVRFRAIASAKTTVKVLQEPLNVKYLAIAGAKLGDRLLFEPLYVKYLSIATAKMGDEAVTIPSNAVTVNGDAVTVNGDYVTVS